MEQLKTSQIGGISIVCFIVVVVASLSYYQFLFLPAYNAKPVVADIILHPSQTTKINIAVGSSQQSQANNFEPKRITGELGVSNKIVWTNTDLYLIQLLVIATMWIQQMESLILYLLLD